MSDIKRIDAVGRSVTASFIDSEPSVKLVAEVQLRHPASWYINRVFCVV